MGNLHRIGENFRIQATACLRKAEQNGALADARLIRSALGYVAQGEATTEQEREALQRWGFR